MHTIHHYPEWIELYNLDTLVTNITSHFGIWDEVVEDFNHPDVELISAQCPLEDPVKPGLSLHARSPLDLSKLFQMLLDRVDQANRSNFAPPARAANNDWRKSSEKPMNHKRYGRVLELSRDGVHAVVRLNGTQETKETHVTNLTEIPQDPEPHLIPDVTKASNKKSWGNLTPYIAQAKTALKKNNVKKPTRSQIESVAKQIQEIDQQIRIEI